MIKIGNCPDSWGIWFDQDDRQIDWNQYLDEVAEAGYRYTEIGPYGYMSTDPAELSAALRDRGLIPLAGTIMFDLECDDQMPAAVGTAQKCCALLKAIGARYYIIMDGMYTDLMTDAVLWPRTLSDAAFEKLCANYIRLANVVLSAGIQPIFHPHGGTHVETEAQIDRMISRIPDNLLRLCFDTGHHIYVPGNDLYRYTEKIADKIEYFHFKDLVPSIKADCWARQIPYASATKRQIFAEIGHGEIDWPRYARLLKKLKFNGYAVIEHDCYPADFSRPKLIQSRTGRYLESIGIGTLK